MRLLIAILAALGLAAYATYALAAGDGVPVSTFFDPIRPYLAEVVGVLIAALVAWLVKRIRDWTGIEIEARHREALQSALTNGAKIAIDRAARRTERLTVPIGNAILKEGVDYVLRSVPDAVRHFGLTPERVGELLRPHVNGP